MPASAVTPARTAANANAKIASAANAAPPRKAAAVAMLASAVTPARTAANASAKIASAANAVRKSKFVGNDNTEHFKN
jgi:hypothetical protein